MFAIKVFNELNASGDELIYASVPVCILTSEELVPKSNYENALRLSFECRKLAIEQFECSRLTIISEVPTITKNHYFDNVNLHVTYISFVIINYKYVVVKIFTR